MLWWYRYTYSAIFPNGGANVFRICRICFQWFLRFEGFDRSVLYITIIKTPIKKSIWSLSHKCLNECFYMHVSPCACLRQFEL